MNVRSIPLFARHLAGRAKRHRLVRKVKRMFRLGMPLRLNLGCGDKLLEGYVNIDVAPSRKGVKPDLLADLRDLPYEVQSIDEILLVHVIEHFYPWEADQLLRYWHSLLKPGAKIVLECPNLLTAARALANDESLASDLSEGRGGQVMWPLYGDPGWKDPLMCHRWGYTPASLQKLLADCGYRDARQEPAEFKKRDPRDMRVVARR
jgi:SAM-dependent methyltransferase